MSRVPEHWAGSAEVPWTCGIANDWVTAGSLTSWELQREWLNVQSGHRERAQPFGVGSGFWLARFLCIGCLWDPAAAPASAY